jgi:hypothetical protein
LFPVVDVPVCKSVQPRIYGVSKRELVNVLCEVEANPPDVRFRWTFNNSAEMIRVPKVRLASVVLVKRLGSIEANTPDVRFRWTFNNSAEMIRVPKVGLASWF